VDHQIIGPNVLRARKNRGATQEEVARASGLSRAAYRAIEKGRSVPQVENLRSIARALSVPVRELVSPAPQLENVRFRSLKRLKTRDQILLDVARWLHDFAELENLLDDHCAHTLDALVEQAVELRGQGIEAVASAAREHFGLSAREPVHDICGLLESQGVKVLQVHVASDAFLGLSVAARDGGPAVIVNTWERLPVERWIFSAAHELGHLVLHLGAYDVRAQAEDPDQEREAEVFASHFLMPDAVFRREWEDTAGCSLLDRVLKVKRVFRVSWRAVVFRVSEGLPEEQRARLWRRVHAEHKRRTGQTLLKLQEPGSVPKSVFQSPAILSPAGREPARLDVHDFQGDRLALLVRRAVERELISLSRGAEILGLTNGEMRERTASWVA